MVARGEGKLTRRGGGGLGGAVVAQGVRWWLGGSGLGSGHQRRRSKRERERKRKWGEEDFFRY